MSDKKVDDTKNNNINYINISDELKLKLKNDVSEFIQFGDDISDLQKKIKEIKLKKDQCEQNIIDNLEKLETSTIEINGIKLTKNKSETKSACNSELIKKTLEEELNDIKKVNKLLEKIEDNRESKERVYLKRSTAKINTRKQKDKK